MNEREDTIILHPDLDVGGYAVTEPALPGVVTEGDTLEEAIAMAKDAIACHVAALRATGRPVWVHCVKPLREAGSFVGPNRTR
ncbi:MAG TPA: type II toxin-antitoxin system HicB family antitoxin [Chloroflexota bacterium]|nr:type II toxin-antitoxin system HicB family antitoxin [Chloroflexota bacterium]